ncbi:uncharacterized protein JCM10292_002349 [Rhodotorula paludigena]|uniref:SigF-like NTF2-like domain-containing protein n=1 Tax=Rhodotorula paludigena TaxID=86838 RepID=A0AAV5GE21_9BASI|nr:hypothetical protein Rhopal_000955-T1 [Rhodotorula paludigena]
MDDPQTDVRRVVSELCEPQDAAEMVAAVEKYFTEDAVFVYPLLNSPKSVGREGVKAAYKMLRVLSYGQRFDFHAVGFDRITVHKGVERMKGFLDLTEHLKLSFIPLPERLNPTFHIRFLSRIDFVKGPDDKWYIEKQEDNIPSDFGSTGLHLLPYDVQISNAIKYITGMGTFLLGSTLNKYKLL